MKKKRHSIQDIANEFNVSKTSISLILNGRGKEKRISDALIKRVLKYVKKVGYQPHSVAQSLRTGKSNVLVVMVEDIYSRLARVIEDVAYKKGYHVLFCSNDNSDQKSKKLLSLFETKQVDGYIIVPSSGIKEDIQKLVENEVPVLLFDRYFPDLQVEHVIANNKQATYTAINHLIKNGYHKILFLTIDTAQTQMLDRRYGYQQAIQENGLTEQILEIPYGNSSPSEQIALLEARLDQPNTFDALFFGTNYLGVSTLELLHAKYPHYLETKGFFCFDDHILFKLHTPPISAISQPIKAFGEALITLLLQQIKNKEEKITQPLSTVLDCQIIYRKSSMPLSER